VGDILACVFLCCQEKCEVRAGTHKDTEHLNKIFDLVIGYLQFLFNTRNHRPPQLHKDLLVVFDLPNCHDVEYQDLFDPFIEMRR
jgi:hypothetical protein